MRLMSLGGSRAGGHKTEVPMGGNITIQGNVVTHDYISNANLSVPVTFGGNLLLVGGGGGGGTGIGGGGGAGGLVFNPNEVIPRNYYNVNVGVGGSGATSTAQSGAIGGNTSLKYVSNTQVVVNSTIKFNLGGLQVAIWNPVNGYNNSNNEGSVIVSQERVFVNELLLIGGGAGGGSTTRPDNTNIGNGGAPGTIYYSNNFYLDPGTYTVKVGKGGFASHGALYYDGTNSYGIGVSAEKNSLTRFGNFTTPPITENTTPIANNGPNGTSIYTDLLKLVNQYLPANQAIGKLIDGKYYVAAGGGGSQSVLNGIGGSGGIGGGGNGATFSGGTNITATNASSPGSGGGGSLTLRNAGYTRTRDTIYVPIDKGLVIPGLGANGIAIMTYFTSGDVFVAYGGGGGASGGSAASAIGGSGGGGNGASSNISPGGKAYVTQGNDGGLGLGIAGGGGVAGGGGGSLGYTTSVNVRTSGGIGNQVPLTCDILLVAGGGGGAAYGGGGGAGGLIYLTNQSIPTGSYVVTVGQGGTGGPANGSNFGTATRGGYSSITGTGFTSAVAVGGGIGMTSDRTTYVFGSDNLTDGGSGGGSSGANGGTPGYGITGQGNSGGQGQGSNQNNSGGGGGAGGAGTYVGGIGLQNSISGTATYYAGGGGGGGWQRVNIAGGLGGGGASSPTGAAGGNGTANTGGGGGGGVYPTSGGNGGSGVVFIRYPTSMVKSSSTVIGGIKTTSGIYTVHQFTTTGNFVITSSTDSPIIPISGGGSGGQPTPIKIPTNDVVYYAGGGGGSGAGGAGGGTGGDGNESGGAGGTGSVGQAGVDYTGGGGGGTGSSDISGANRGGSGRAAVKYLTWANQGLRNSLYTCRDVNEVNDGNWHILYFDKKTEFLLHRPITAAEILIVAAGGKGSTYGAGGGGGGVVYIPEYTLPAASYEIKVGQPNSLWSDDGFGIPNQTAGSFNQASVSGGNSFIRTRTLDINLVAVGGGAGGYTAAATVSNFPLDQGGVPGGSAGGGVNLGSTYYRPRAVSGIQKTLPGDSGKYGYGNAGGDANMGTASYVGGGGGGAGSAGAGPNSTSNGGDGLLLTISGKPEYYSAGGLGIAFGLQGGNGLGWDVSPNSSGGYGSGGMGGNYSTAGQNNAKRGIVIVKFNTSNRVMGGRMTSFGPYTLHTFKDVGIHGFENLLDIVVDILIVGGGGGGGAGAGGGGGAGGYVYQKNVTMPADYYQIQVGDGGLGGNPSSPGNTFNGNNGGDSYISGNFLTLNASGGGGGVGATGSNSGVQGGSGGGGSVNAARQILSPGIGNGSQGFAGGAGIIMSDVADTNRKFIVSGGGGGAAEKGVDGVGVIDTSRPNFLAPGPPVPGKGGSGLSNDITGTATYYAGGGGGGGSILMIPASGPAPAVPTYPRAIVGGKDTYTTGGGGPGYNITTNHYNQGLGPTTPVLDGLANTGGGGGGGFSKVNYTTFDITNEKAGGKGGSGIVIIRYLSASIPLGNA